MMRRMTASHVIAMTGTGITLLAAIAAQGAVAQKLSGSGDPAFALTASLMAATWVALSMGVMFVTIHNALFPYHER